LIKFTLKAQEVIQNSQDIASKKGHQQIEPEHVLYALLEQREGVIPSLFGKIGIKEDVVLHELIQALDQLPKVSGAGGDAYISPRSKRVFDQALKEAGQMRDEYVSVEHILLAIIEDKEGKAAKILASHGLTRDTILNALIDIRGGQRVVDANPEDKYNAIDRFSRDLTDMAENDKLDPVIGRDDEIRRVIQVLSQKNQE